MPLAGLKSAKVTLTDLVASYSPFEPLRTQGESVALIVTPQLFVALPAFGSKLQRVPPARLQAHFK